MSDCPLEEVLNWASLPFGEPKMDKCLFSFDSNEKGINATVDDTDAFLKEIYLGVVNSSEVTSMKMYWPVNLDLESLLAANPPKFCKKVKIDNFKHIINLILTLRSREIKTHRSQFPFVPLSAKLLQKVIHNYQDYLQYLVDVDVLVRYNRYIPREQCKGYRLADKYQNQAIIEDSIIDEKVIKVIASEKKQRESRAEEKYPALRHWIECTEFDYDGAYRTMLKEGLGYRHERQLCRFQNRDWYFKVDDKAGRLHTSVNGLPKIYRPFLTYQEKHLKAIDMSSAQPYLATCLFYPYFYQIAVESTPRITIQQLFGNFRNAKSSPEVFEQLSLNVLQFLEKNEIPQEEVKKYIEWVESGKFYQRFASHLQNESGGGIVFDNDKIKRIMFKVLNSKDKGYITRAKRLFKDTFPFIYEVFYLLKRRSHKHVSHLLQAMEAHIILDRVVGRITRECPDVPLYTVHDCVATIPEHIEYVKRVMSEELYQAVGLYPPLKIESWE